MFFLLDGKCFNEVLIKKNLKYEVPNSTLPLTVTGDYYYNYNILEIYLKLN